MACSLGGFLMPNLLLVMLGGALGSLARYGVGLGAAQLFGPTFPIGTMFINITGSFVLGVLVSLSGPMAIGPNTRLLLATGFCGAYTTFSTFSVETLNLMEKGSYGLALVYLLGNLLGGILAAWAGFILARTL
jgi:fluoride exporter